MASITAPCACRRYLPLRLRGAVRWTRDALLPPSAAALCLAAFVGGLAPCHAFESSLAISSASCSHFSVPSLARASFITSGLPWNVGLLRRQSAASTSARPLHSMNVNPRGFPVSRAVGRAQKGGQPSRAAPVRFWCARAYQHTLWPRRSLALCFLPRWPTRLFRQIGSAAMTRSCETRQASPLRRPAP